MSGYRQKGKKMNYTLEELMEQYEAMYIELTPLTARMNEVKNQIVARVKEEGEPAKHGNVSATIRSGYTRQTWDGKGLTGYAVAHPEVLAFRKEKRIGLSVAVKVAAALHTAGRPGRSADMDT